MRGLSSPAIVVVVLFDPFASREVAQMNELRVWIIVAWVTLPTAGVDIIKMRS